MAVAIQVLGQMKRFAVKASFSGQNFCLGLSATTTSPFKTKQEQKHTPVLVNQLGQEAHSGQFTCAESQEHGRQLFSRGSSSKEVLPSSRCRRLIWFWHSSSSHELLFNATNSRLTIQLLEARLKTASLSRRTTHHAARTHKESVLNYLEM